jgi:hypothetical protein
MPAILLLLLALDSFRRLATPPGSAVPALVGAQPHLEFVEFGHFLGVQDAHALERFRSNRADLRANLVEFAQGSGSLFLRARGKRSCSNEIRAITSS